MLNENCQANRRLREQIQEFFNGDAIYRDGTLVPPFVLRADPKVPFWCMCESLVDEMVLVYGGIVFSPVIGCMVV